MLWRKTNIKILTSINVNDWRQSDLTHSPLNAENGSNFRITFSWLFSADRPTVVWYMDNYFLMSAEVNVHLSSIREMLHCSQSKNHFTFHPRTHLDETLKTQLWIKQTLHRTVDLKIEFYLHWARLYYHLEKCCNLPISYECGTCRLEWVIAR